MKSYEMFLESRAEQIRKAGEDALDEIQGKKPLKLSQSKPKPPSTEQKVNQWAKKKAPSLPSTPPKRGDQPMSGPEKAKYEAEKKKRLDADKKEQMKKKAARDKTMKKVGAVATGVGKVAKAAITMDNQNQGGRMTSPTTGSGQGLSGRVTTRSPK